MPSHVTLIDYLLTRLRQLGIRSCHGVPGDYNLELLDYVEEQMHWVGNCNELNAGYAADAYARIGGVSALITTFGVGELSAINAIAGSYAELVPVIHIVGSPSRETQECHRLVHHTLNDGQYSHFSDMYKHVTVAQALLRDPILCPQQIDFVIQQCLQASRPVYIEVPSDMVVAKVAADRLETIIPMPIRPMAQDESDAVECIVQQMNNAKSPMILIDGQSKAYGILGQLHDLVASTGFPTWTTVFGKSLIDESLPNVYGVYKGTSAPIEHQTFVDACDLVLCFGPHFTSTNTYDYSVVPKEAVSILFKSSEVSTSTRIYRDVDIKRLTTSLVESIRKLDLKKSPQPPQFNADIKISSTVTGADDSRVNQGRFWRVVNRIIEPGDIVLAETGTAGHGCRDFILPPNATLFKPVTWLSIGYMLPAAQGAALAQRELHELGKWSSEADGSQIRKAPRTILFIGDGSYQLTFQELSTIIKLKLNVVVFLINNDGYTIERCLHGRSRKYNDVASWNYLQAPAMFGASLDREGKEYYAETHTVRTWEDLDRALNEDEEARRHSRLKMVEVFMDREDAPEALLERLRLQD